MLLQDRGLLRGLVSGKKPAYAEAVEQHYRHIHSFLYGLCMDAALAEDMTQDTFVSAWSSIEQFEGRSSLGTWLHAIALNTYRDYKRGQKLLTVPMDEEDGAVPDPAPELIEHLRAEELREVVREAVERMPEMYRAVLVMRMRRGMKYSEIAENLGVPLGTVQYRLHVAVGKLKAALENEVAYYETADI